MFISKYLLSTMKNKPINTETISHELMLKTGMIRKLFSGSYAWLPTGIKVLKKIKKIICEEMNKIEALEINIPIMQSANLWKKSKRFKNFGLELIKLYDRKNKLFILSPTNEEIINKILKNEINSYKQLPIKFYQIKTKFRDEIRPRFGIIRTKEFIMKDAYSFHENYKCLKKTYNNILNTYIKIFKRIGLIFCILKADTGQIGGNLSHEFYILSKNGEKKIIFCNKFNSVSNINNIKIIKPNILNTIFYIEKKRILNFLNNFKINKIIKNFNIPKKKIVKIILLKSNIKNKLTALLIREDHNLNIIKILKFKNIYKPLIFIKEEEVNNLLKKNNNSIKSFFKNIDIIVDYSVIVIKNFIIKFNKNKKIFFGVNFKRDLPLIKIDDLRNFNYEEFNKKYKKKLIIKKGIEIGHIFQIGTKYSNIIKNKIVNKFGLEKKINMGCYGIGITRLVAAIIEQNYDKKGIIWSNEIAPFQISILPINFHKNKNVKNITYKIYKKLYNKKIDVIIDDRNEQLGVMFKDTELIGIPHILIINDKICKNGFIEYKNRIKQKTIFLKLDYINNFLLNILKKKY
ncbi:proline--tRNA ligase [Enterobacterales bacterium endosymbiont of Anomoneura mori]|uniref:proline--tRNA ligase n=1 Tax=Enterobacterales bacterium endosymbiont of Anomoneura mori TaxID=3132096 RepID=UPI00399D2A8B